MKKILLLFSVFLSGYSAMAQSFTGATVVENNTTLTLTAVGEGVVNPFSTVYSINSISGFFNSETTSNDPYNGGHAQDYVNITNQSVINLFNNTHTPTKVSYKLSNAFTQPITVTFKIHVTYNYQLQSITTTIPYTVTVKPTPVIVTPPGVTYPSEGNFVRNDNTGQVYLFFEGKLRYIPNQDVLHGLFVFNDNLLKHYTAAQLTNLGVPVGVAINPDNGLINDTNTGAVYFREANLVRWVRSAAAMDRYHFSWASIKNRAGIAGYDVGADIN